MARKTTDTKCYILHGWAYETAKWHPFLQELEKHGIQATLLKIPGLTTSLSTPWNPADYVSWLHTQFRKTAGKTILIGHSNGGRIALWYAVSHPDKLSRLILIDSAGVPERRLLHLIKRRVFRRLAKTGRRFTDAPQLRKVLYRLAGVRDYDTATPVMKQTMVNLITADPDLPLESIAVPVDIIWGDQDTVTPLSDGRELAKRIPKAHLTVIPEARHAPQFTHRERTVREILAILNV